MCVLLLMKKLMHLYPVLLYLDLPSTVANDVLQTFNRINENS